MYFCVQLSDFLKCNFGQLHAIALKNAVCERRGMKYAFLRATVRFLKCNVGELGDAAATAARPADAAASPAEDGAAASPAEDGAAACPAEDDDAGSDADAVANKEDGALPSAPAGPARPGAARNGSARPGLGSV